MSNEHTTDNSPSYCYSTDEEHYTGKFATREQAAKEAFAEDEDLEVCFTGMAVVPERIPSAFDLVDQVAERTTDESGDWADGYLERIPAHAMDELQEELQELWDRWEKKHGLEPHWFNVENVKEHRRQESVDSSKP